MKKVKILGTALAAIVGLGGAVAMQLKQDEAPYKRIGNTLHRIANYDEAFCDGPTTDACVYWLEDSAPMQVEFDDPNYTKTPDPSTSEYIGPLN